MIFPGDRENISKSYLTAIRSITFKKKLTVCSWRYKKLLDHWHTTDVELLGGLILEICDLHIHGSLDLKNKFSEIGKNQTRSI